MRELFLYLTTSNDLDLLCEENQLDFDDHHVVFDNFLRHPAVRLGGGVVLLHRPHFVFDVGNHGFKL